jgi:maleylpyruvate isomerase
MPRPDTEIAACHASHDRLHRSIQTLDDAAMRQPSRLPGWSVGHVVAHLARNADSVVRRLRAAIEGNVVDQYEGGDAGRAAQIEEGAHRSAAEAFDDLVRADAAVEAIYLTVPDEAWDRPFATPNAWREFQQRPASFLPFTRWREVEIHHVDLGIGYEFSQWPQALVDAWLPGMLQTLPERTDARQLLAWTLGREAPPVLDSWG